MIKPLDSPFTPTGQWKEVYEKGLLVSHMEFSFNRRILKAVTIKVSFGLFFKKGYES